MSKSEKVVYTSRVRIERNAGPMRLAYLPAEKEPVVLGVHSRLPSITGFRRMPSRPMPQPWITDYVVAVTGG